MQSPTTNLVPNSIHPDDIPVFDIAKYLDTEERIAGYLDSVLQDNDAELLVAALGHVARANRHFPRSAVPGVKTQQKTAL